MSAHPKQRWLILAHAFNMDGRAASQTITDKIPHLLAANIELVVLSGALGVKDTRFEHHQLWPWGPAGIRFELRHVLRERLGSGALYRLVMTLASLVLWPGMLIEKLLFPFESSWSWRFAALAKARALSRQQKFDWVYSTGGAYAAHLAACDIHRQLGLPWLAEVHDPLVMPGRSPNTPQEKMKLEVERRICSDAQVALWFTDQALASAKKRHPHLGARGHVLLPGIDNPFSNGLPPYVPGSKMVIGHFGSLSNTRSLYWVIDALDVLQTQSPQVWSDLELHLTGGPLDAQTQMRLQQSPSSSRVCHLGRIEADPASGLSGRAQILQRMRSVDVLLLIHGQEPICAEYMPSKMYEYLWMQRPVLAQVDRNPQMATMLRQLGHTVIEWQSHEQAVQEMVDAWVRIHQSWKQSGLPDLAQRSPYTTEAAVKKLLMHVVE